MSKKKKNLMEDPNFRHYEYGKMTMATEVYKLMEESIEGKKNLNDVFKKFKKDFAPYIALFGKTKPTKYEMKFNYWKTYEYRGLKIKIFDDDYGQQNYFYFNGRCIGCGAYNFDWEGCVKYEVDHYLDDIFSYSEIDKIYSGAYLKYSNHEHTEIVLTYRMDELQVWTLEEGEEFDIDVIKYNGLKILDALFESEEFKKSEAERKARGDLYLYELMEKDKNEKTN